MENYSASYSDEMHARYLELTFTDNSSAKSQWAVENGEYIPMNRQIQTRILNEYLAKCIQNNHHCAHCCLNHNGICFFAKECFENDQKYYNDEDDE